MKKIVQPLFVALFLNFTIVAITFAGSGHSHDSGGSTGDQMDHSTMEQAEDKSGAKPMDHSAMEQTDSQRHGEVIHKSMVNGYHLEYRLIDIRDKMKGVKGMEHMTHHMMVFVMGPQKIEKIMVGYMIDGPGGEKQKKMAMTMGGGSGADVSLMAKGSYTIMTKAVADGKKLMDKFHYEVK